MDLQELDRIVSRIQASGCLNAGELQSQKRMLQGWQTLQNIDQLDHQWEADLKQHTYRLAKFGKPHVPTTSDTVAYGIFGILCICLGVFFIIQTNAGIAPSPLGYWTAAGALGMAGLLLFWTVSSFQNRKKYQPLLDDYSTDRRLQLNQLAAEHRPGARICLKCLHRTE